MIKELISKNRSYRRYCEEFEISEKTLLDLVDLARLSATAGNLQPLKYIISSDRKTNAQIFPCLSWASYLQDWPGPIPGERPSAYIIMLGDTSITKSYFCNHGIAAQSILLGATEIGLGGCIFASVRRDELRSALHIPEKYEIIQVISLGKPKEKVVIENLPAGGDIKYWRDENQVHHVPKRSLDEIILKL